MNPHSQGKDIVLEEVSQHETKKEPQKIVIENLEDFSNSIKKEIEGLPVKKNPKEKDLKVPENMILKYDFSQYELPKEVTDPIEKHIENITKFGLFMANNKIFVLKTTEKKKYFKEVSNFEISVIQHMQDELKPLKLIRIKNVHGKECVFDTASNQINSIAKFDDLVTSYGNYLFTGTKVEFDLLRGFLFEKMGNGKKIDGLGFQKEFNIWIWNNKVNLFNGDSIDISEDGIFKHNNNSFYVPSANKVYKDNNSRYVSQKKFKICTSNTDFKEFSRLLFLVYGNHSISAVLFSIASIFQDIIVNETKFFPILFLQGQASSGKDSLAFCCQSFVGVPQDKISIGAGVSTQKAQIRELAQFVNGISQFAEYKPGEKQTDEILKGVWDRSGYKIGTVESKISTDVIPVLGSLIVTSNNTPIDDALISRLIWLNLDKNSGFTTEEISNYDKLLDRANNGVSFISDDLLSHRKEFDDNFKILYRKNKKTLTDLFGEATARIASNYAVLYSTFEIFRPYIQFPFTEDELKNYFVRNSAFQMNKIKTSNIVSRWWDCFYECLTTNGENRVIISIDFISEENTIAFNFSAIYGKIQRHWYNQFKEQSPSKDTMYEALKNNNSFIKQKPSFRINKTVTTGVIFDVKKIEIGNEIMDRINSILSP